MRLLLTASVVFLLACVVLHVSSAWAAPQTIYVVNHSSLPDAEIAAALPIFQAAVDEDFGPVWNAYAKLVLVEAAPVQSWQIEIQDEEHLPWNAAGYHELHGRFPYALVGQGEHYNWQVVFSHELFEMLADPYIDRASYAYLCGAYYCYSPKFYAVEVADPVQDERWAYQRNGVAISDFVTPEWFDGQGGGKLDFRGVLRRHHTLALGGYIYVCTDGTWAPLDRHTFRRQRSRGF